MHLGPRPQDGVDNDADLYGDSQLALVARHCPVEAEQEVRSWG